MSSFHLAELNIAKMIAPLDHPTMSDFVANLDRINALADNASGFVWRLKNENNNATSVKVFEDDFLLVNLSVWTTIASLTDFVYRSQHMEILKRKKEWFEKMQTMHMVLWPVHAGHVPTVDEAVERLVHLRQHGETPFAFSFKKQFHPESGLFK